MDTPPTPQESLLPVVQRLRAAQQQNPPDYAQRMRDLGNLAAAIKRYQEDIVRAVSADFGRRSRQETLIADVWIVLDEIAFLRRHLRRWMRPTYPGISLLFQPARNEVQAQPLGVVGIIAPWNYPVQLCLVPLADAIAAGNHVAIKPSEFTPRTSELLSRLLAEVFPGDRVAMLPGGAEVGAAFTQLPLDHLLFTGSTAVGRKVMAAAAENLTPVTLELGGKSPALIAPDYPIEQAAERIATGKCFNAGQTCIAPDYVLVPREQRDAFARAFMASLKRRYPTLASNPDYTAIINARQANRLRDWLDEARQHGVAVMQHRPDGESPPPGVEIIAPTLLLDPPEELTVMREEIFGPLLPIKSYDDFDAAIDYIVGKPRPLAFYPFDRNRRRLQKTMTRVVAGGVTINDTLLHFGQHEMPAGGVGASGIGSYHGHAGFLAMSKLVPVFRQSRFNGVGLFDPPYGKLIDRALAFLTR